MDAIRASARSRQRYAKIRGGLNWGAPNHCTCSITSTKGAAPAAEDRGSRTTEVAASSATMAPALQEVPTAPGTMRWHGLPPLTALSFTNKVWNEVSAFDNPRVDAGCRSDVHSPAIQSNASTKRERLVRGREVLLAQAGFGCIDAFSPAAGQLANHLSVMPSCYVLAII